MVRRSKFIDIFAETTTVGPWYINICFAGADQMYSKPVYIGDNLSIKSLFKIQGLYETHVKA